MILANGSSQSIAPQAYAETSPLFYQGYFLPETGLNLATTFATYAALYRAQPWIATVVDKIAGLIAKLGLTVWDTTPTTGNVADKTGPMAKLIADPCQTMDPYSFWLWLTTTLEIYGEAFLLKDRNPVGGKLIGLVPMHPAMTQIERDDEGTLKYRFTGATDEWFPESEVVPFRRYNPDTSMRGLSRLEPLRTTLLNEDGARRAEGSSWNNFCRPSMLLSTEKKMSDTGRERLQQAFTAKYAGADRAGKVILLEDGITATQMQLTAEQMQYIQARKLNREEVCAVYDIAPTMVGILDHATFSNISEQRGALYRETVIPRTSFMESVINFHLGFEFNGTREAKFNVAEQLRGDLEKLAPAAAQLAQVGMLKPKEGRQWLGLDDGGPEADELYANSAIQRLGQPGEQERIVATAAPGRTPDLVPVEAGKPPAPIAAAAASKYVRHISGLIGRGKTLKEAAWAVLDAHPEDEAAIVAACKHIMERQ